MITKEKARKIVESEGETFSDEQIEKIIEFLEGYADILIEVYDIKGEALKEQKEDNEKS